MAIYKNREVSVIGPNTMSNTPESINIQYKDGSHENVSVSEVFFIEEEKKTLMKNNPGKYSDISLVSHQDLVAIRAGLTPPSDPSYQAPVQTEQIKK